MAILKVGIETCIGNEMVFGFTICGYLQWPLVDDVLEESKNYLVIHRLQDV